MALHKWALSYAREVPSEISKFPQHDIDQIFSGIRELLEADNPRDLPQVKPLVGKNCRGQYRLRYGNYRIRFAVEPGEIITARYTYHGQLRIIAVKHRREAYDDC